VFIEAIHLDADAPDQWPFTMPMVRQLAAQGLTFARSVTFLGGENGSGKSTLIEAIADTVKINSEGGKAGTRYASTGEKTSLVQRLVSP
jgi:predicted ATPase